jgi:hypothetical protein
MHKPALLVTRIRTCIQSAIRKEEVVSKLDEIEMPFHRPKPAPHFEHPSISGLKPEKLASRIFTQTPSISRLSQLTFRKQRPSGYEPEGRSPLAPIYHNSATYTIGKAGNSGELLLDSIEMLALTALSVNVVMDSSEMSKI